jgi:hypothetical protein
MPNNLYVHVYMIDKKPISENVFNYILENWDIISRSDKKPSLGIEEIYIPTVCRDYVYDFLENMAKISDGICIRYCSEFTMCEEMTFAVSMNKKWHEIITVNTSNITKYSIENGLNNFLEKQKE